jgi:hypothetical protein
MTQGWISIVTHVIIYTGRRLPEQAGFDPETFFAVTEERLAFAEPLDSTIWNLNAIETSKISVARILNFG